MRLDTLVKHQISRGKSTVILLSSRTWLAAINFPHPVMLFISDHIAIYPLVMLGQTILPAVSRTSVISDWVITERCAITQALTDMTSYLPLHQPALCESAGLRAKMPSKVACHATWEIDCTRDITVSFSASAFWSLCLGSVKYWSARHIPTIERPSTHTTRVCGVSIPGLNLNQPRPVIREESRHVRSSC